MKKVLAICLMAVMTVSMSLNVFAAPAGFVSSPSGKIAPEIVSFTPSNDDCTAKLKIVPYGEKDDLSDTLRTMFEKAYNEIVKAQDLTKLNGDLAKIASDKKIKGENLAVSDLFDIHVTGCDYHSEHVDFDIVLNADTLSHFVALLHMNKDGVWEVVSDAKVVNNGEHLKFSVDSFSPFAIVVETSSENSPQTGDNSMIYVYVITMVVSAVALITVLTILFLKKKKAN